MNDSRMSKYSDLRAGLKDEAGINRNNNEIKENVVDDNEDDFLSSVNRSFKQEKKNVIDIDDTLTEAKTFEQMRQESSEEINRALRSAKAGVGKEDQYNTRMDILNKIREPERHVVHVDNLDNVNTAEFSKGYFVNSEKTVEEPVVKEKKKMTLMERLASMSPEEDAKKAKLVMEEAEITDIDEVKEDTIDQSKSLEDMLRQIKEKDQREVERVLKERENTEELNKIKKDIEIKEDNDLLDDDEKTRRVATILNYIIILLIVVFVGLCGMIGYQLFF